MFFPDAKRHCCLDITVLYCFIIDKLVRLVTRYMNVEWSEAEPNHYATQ